MGLAPTHDAIALTGAMAVILDFTAVRATETGGDLVLEIAM